MTAADELVRLPEVTQRSWPRLLGWSVLVGVLLGAVDLMLQLTLPFPWANVANSSAAWAVVAFGIGASVRVGLLRSMLAGVLMLMVAVETYYLLAVACLGDDVSTLWSATTVTWLAFAILAGVVVGAAGAFSQGTSAWQAMLGPSLPVAALFGEAALESVRTRVVAPEAVLNPTSTALITAVLGIVVLTVAARRPLHAAGALLLSLPLSVLFLVAFRMVGFTL